VLSQFHITVSVRRLEKPVTRTVRHTAGTLAHTCVRERMEGEGEGWKTEEGGREREGGRMV
jgi:hypothetical protein